MNRSFGKTLLHLLRRAWRHAGRSAHERDSTSRFGGYLGALPNQIGAVDPATERRAQQRGRPQYGHAIRSDQIGSPYLLGEDRIALCFHHEIYIAGDDVQTLVFDDRAPDASHDVIK